MADQKQYCSNVKCIRLYGAICDLFATSFITGTVLFPNGTNFLYTDFIDTIHDDGISNPLRACLYANDAGSRLCNVLWNALRGDAPSPTKQRVASLLDVIHLFKESAGVCTHRFLPFLRIPATLRGRIARTASCIASCHLCVTAVLWLATSSPASICPISQSVGVICNVGWSEIPKNGRVISIGNTIPQSFQAICQIRINGETFKLGIRDAVSAARAVPLEFSTLRSSLSAGPDRRFLCKWQYPWQGITSDVASNQPVYRKWERKPDRIFTRLSLHPQWLHVGHSCRMNCKWHI